MADQLFLKEWVMSKVVVVGDGPGGLSAALFLAKNGQDVTVFGKNGTALHYAMLYNYLGISEITGPEFARIAREQVSRFGATLVEQNITQIEKTGDGFICTAEDGSTYASNYVVLAEGKGLKLARTLNLAETDAGVQVDRDGRTAIDGLYAVGRMTRRVRSQTVISAGEGAAAALDILSREAGKDVNDFDSLP
jgi:thioredoxin reductase